MEAIIFCGTQASGKSSFYRSRFFSSHLRISRDVVRTRRREEILLDACFRAGQRFVVDKTNPARADRTRYVLLAQEAKFSIAAYCFVSTLADCLSRNAGRAGKERIPDRGVRATFASFEPAGFDEGFDGIYMVQLANGGFEVEELRP